MKRPPYIVCLWIVFLFVWGWLCSPVTWAQAPPYGKTVVYLGECKGPEGGTLATITQIGSAQVTAHHWAGGGACTPFTQSYVHFPEYDISVVQAGDPGVCRDAELGEPLGYVGFPGTDLSGKPVTQSAVEGDTGFVLVKGGSITLGNRAGSPVVLQNVDFGFSTRVRPGYSGGVVVSLKDRRAVGIINGVGALTTVFTPISTVCKLIKEAQHVQGR